MSDNDRMQPAGNIEAMRETLNFVIISAIPAQHKRILIDAVVEAMRKQESERHLAATRCDYEPWLPHEIESAKVFLTGRVARSWQHADEIVMRLADQLHRNAADVRTKSIELGFGVSVDFRQAKAILAQGDAG